MDNAENTNLVIEVTTLKGGITAKDSRGNVYKIQSIMLGMGSHRKPVEVDKKYPLREGSEYRAEIIPKSGKLNIL